MNFDLFGFRSLALVTAAAVVMTQPAIAQEQVQARDFNIGPQGLASALNEFGRQSGRDIVFSREALGSRRTQGVQGKHTPEEALRLLLEGSDLQYRTNQDGTYLVEVRRPEGPATRPADERGTSRDEGAKSEILVIGRRTLNVDIRRTEDDAQPYVVYSGDEIRQSGALNLEEFFRQRLPMNAQAPSGLDGYLQGAFTGGLGTLNLRGLGTNQTLVLVDGRRVPGVAFGFDFGQPNINGISTSAVERIEILPSTASGAFGGGATGGVVNIIMKRDFSGLDVSALYGNTFDSAAGHVELNLSGGFKVWGTRVTVSASHVEQDDLDSADRDFGTRAFDIFKRNYPTYLSLPSLANGPTPNVISDSGANLVLDPAYGGASLNSPWTYVPTGYAGPASDNAAGLRANAGQLRVTGQPAILYTGPTVNSVSMDVHRDLTSRLEAYANLYWDRSVSSFSMPQVTTISLAAADPNNPFQQDITVALPLYENDVSTHARSEIQTRRANLGLIARLPFNWSGTLDYGWSKSETPTVTGFVFGPTAEGTSAFQAAALRDLAAFPVAGAQSMLIISDQRNPDPSNQLEDISLRVSGPLTHLPGGSLTLSGLLEHRLESYDDFVISRIAPPLPSSYSWTPAGEQKVDSAYLELRAPLVSAKNGVTLVEDLELMGSVRRDNYKTHWAAQQVGVLGPDGPFPPQTYADAKLSSTDYTLGLRYSPLRDLTIRASYGTGFVPPKLSNIKATVNDFPAGNLTTLADPQRGGTRLTGDPTTRRVRIARNGDTSLQAEDSTSLSYGFILEPLALEGLRFSADLTEIKKTGEISSPGEQFFLNNEALYPERIQRAPNLPTDPAGWAGPVIFINSAPVNLLSSTIRAIDLQLDYSLGTQHWGNWHFYLVGTDQLKFARQISVRFAPADRVGYNDGMVQWRGNAGLDWNAGPWSLGWNTQYSDGYSLCYSTFTEAECATNDAVLSQGTTRVPSQMYHDAFVRYHFDDNAYSALANTEINLGIQNVFDKSPPILATGLYSGYGDPRLRRYMLTFRRHFGG